MPTLEEGGRRKAELKTLCEALRRGEGEAKRVRRRKDEGRERVEWCCGHVFRHRLFGYVGVVVGWDGFCAASEECKFGAGFFWI